MSIIGFDGKEYDSVEAMQAAMLQQDRDKLRARGKEVGFDDAFFGSDEFTQFEKDNPHSGMYPAVVQYDPYGFGGAPRTAALAQSYTQYLQRTGQQDKIKTEVKDGLGDFPPTKGRKVEENESFMDYYRLPDGTGFAHDRRTREAVPTGATKVAYEEFQRLASGATQLQDSTTEQIKGTTGKEFEESLVKKQAELAQTPTLPPGREIDPTLMYAQTGEIVDPTVGKVQDRPGATVSATLDTADFAQTAPEVVQAQQVEAAQAGSIDDMAAATGQLSQGALMKAAQASLSPESLAVAATAELDPRSTTRYQLAELFSTIEEGKPLPAWAAPAVRRVSAIMQQRGLGASSMAAAATVQAIMESGIPIAAQDAQKYAAVQLQNLSNQQQAVLQNAAASAQMDTANLNARQQAAANNAKSFLSLDIQNLTNEQQAATISYQGALQAKLSDVAQMNAAQQFNAKSQNQIETFFAQLGVQVESATLNRKAAIEQYNVSQASAMSQFNTQMQAARDQFNASMSAQIAQSNATWRRNINTSNTASINAANQQNVMNLLQINQQSLNNLWQAYRDQASWNLQISENNLARAHNAAMQSMSIAANADMYSDKFDDFLKIKAIDNIFPVYKSD